MLGTLLEKKLKDREGEKILVVMDDGLAFLGTLDDFDKYTIVLTDVYQGSATEINWSDVTDVYPEEVIEDIESKDTTVGFIDWMYVNMKEVYLRLNHISRIWVWSKRRTEEEEEVEKKEYVYREPVYSKTHDIPNIGSSYDIPGGITRER